MTKPNNIPWFRVLVAACLLVAAFELGGIWNELAGLRREQVKNSVYAMRPDLLARMRAQKNLQNRLRALEGMVKVDDADGITVKSDVLNRFVVKVDDAEQPLQVEIQGR